MSKARKWSLIQSATIPLIVHLLFLKQPFLLLLTAEEENDQEEIFADLRVVKQQAKQLEKRAELEFCQVKYSKCPWQTEPTGDDYLYANVHKFRWFKWSVLPHRLHHWRSMERRADVKMSKGL